MALSESKRQFSYKRSAPYIVEADSEQGQPTPLVPGVDRFAMEAEHPADQSADDHAVGDAITVRGRRTSILAGTRFGG